MTKAQSTFSPTWLTIPLPDPWGWMPMHYSMLPDIIPNLMELGHSPVLPPLSIINFHVPSKNPPPLPSSKQDSKPTYFLRPMARPFSVLIIIFHYLYAISCFIMVPTCGTLSRFLLTIPWRLQGDRLNRVPTASLHVEIFAHQATRGLEICSVFDVPF